MRNAFLSGLAILSLGLAACETTDGSNSKQIVGTGAGAVLGGLAGSQIGDGSGRLWAVGAGTLIGALLGSEVGKSLDKADIAYARKASDEAHNASVGETISWNNPETGHRGTVTPVRDGLSSSGRYCREYQQTVDIGGKKESGYGTACRQPDGSWEIVN